MISDQVFENRFIEYPVDTPRTKEYYLLRKYFEEHFPSKCAN